MLRKISIILVFLFCGLFFWSVVVSARTRYVTLGGERKQLALNVQEFAKDYSGGRVLSILSASSGGLNSTTYTTYLIEDRAGERRLSIVVTGYMREKGFEFCAVSDEISFQALEVPQNVSWFEVLLPFQRDQAEFLKATCKKK